MAGTGISQAIIVIRATDLASKDLRGIGANFAQLGSKIQQIGLGMTAAFTMPVAMLGAAAANATMEFDKQMRRIQVITNQTDQSLQVLGQGFIQMSTDITKTVDAPKALAEAYFDIVQRGYNVAQSQQLLAVATKSATAAFTDTIVAAKGIGQILQAYGMDVSQAMHVSDILFRTIDRGVVTYDELATGMSKVTPVASLLGVSLEELGGALSVLTLKGSPPQQAFTMLYRVMLTYLKSTDQAKAVAGKYGIVLSSQTIKTKGLMGVVEQLATATDKYGRKLIDNENDLAVMFTRQEGLRGAMMLAADTAKLYADSLAYVSDSTGQTDRAFTDATKAWEAQWKNFKNQIQALAITIGGSLLPILKQFADSIGNITRNLASMPRDQITALVRLGIMIAALGPAAIVAGSIMSAFGGLLNSLTPIVRGVIQAFKSLGISILGLGKAFRVLIRDSAIVVADVFIAIKKTIIGLASILAAGAVGIGKSLIAIGATFISSSVAMLKGVAGIVKAATTLRYTEAAIASAAAAMAKGSVVIMQSTALLSDAAFAIKVGFMAIGRAVIASAASIPGALAYLSRAFVGIFAFMRNSFSVNLPAIKVAIASGLSGIYTALITGGAKIQGAIKAMNLSIAASWKGILSAFTKTGNAQTGIVGLSTALKSFGTAGWAAAGAAIKGIGAALLAFAAVAKIAAIILLAFTGAFIIWKKNIFEFKSTVADLAKAGGFLGDVFSSLQVVFKQLEANKFGQTFSNAIAILTEGRSKTIDWGQVVFNVFRGLAIAVTWVEGVLAQLIIRIKEVIDIFPRIGAMASGVFGSIGARIAYVDALMKAFVDGIRTKISQFITLWSSLYTAITTTAKGIINLVIALDSIGRAITNVLIIPFKIIISLASLVVQAVVSLAKSIWGAFVNVGTAIRDNVVTPLQSVWQVIKDTFSNLATSFMEMLGIVGRALAPLVKALEAVGNTILDYILRPIANVIVKAFNFIINGLIGLINKIAALPIFDPVRDSINDAKASLEDFKLGLQTWSKVGEDAKAIFSTPFISPENSTILAGLSTQISEADQRSSDLWQTNTEGIKEVIKKYDALAKTSWASTDAQIEALKLLNAEFLAVNRNITAEKKHWIDLWKTAAGGKQWFAAQPTPGEVPITPDDFGFDPGDWEDAGKQAADAMRDAIRSALEEGISASISLDDVRYPGGAESPFAPGANGPFEDIYRLQAWAKGMREGTEATWGNIADKYAGGDLAKAMQIIRDFQMGNYTPDVIGMIDKQKFIDILNTQSANQASMDAFVNEMAKMSGLSPDVIKGKMGLPTTGETAAAADTATATTAMAGLSSTMVTHLQNILGFITTNIPILHTDLVNILNAIVARIPLIGTPGAAPIAGIPNPSGTTLIGTNNVNVTIQPGAVQVISDRGAAVADEIVAAVFRAFSKAEERAGYPAPAGLPGAG